MAEFSPDHNLNDPAKDVLDPKQVFDMAVVRADLEALKIPQHAIDDVEQLLGSLEVPTEAEVNSFNEFINEILSDQSIRNADDSIYEGGISGRLKFPSKDEPQLLALEYYLQYPRLCREIDARSIKLLNAESVRMELLASNLAYIQEGSHTTDFIEADRIVYFVDAYLALSMASRIANEDSKSTELKELLVDRAEKDLSGLSSEHLRDFQINLGLALSERGATEELKIIKLLQGRINSGLRDGYSLICELPDRYLDAIDLKQELTRPQDFNFEDFVAQNIESIAGFQIRAIIDPLDDGRKKAVWDEPIDAIIAELNNRAASSLDFRSVLTEEADSETVHLDQQGEASNAELFLVRVLEETSSAGLVDKVKVNLSFFFEYNSLAEFLYRQSGNEKIYQGAADRAQFDEYAAEQISNFMKSNSSDFLAYLRFNNQIKVDEGPQELLSTIRLVNFLKDIDLPVEILVDYDDMSKAMATQDKSFILQPHSQFGLSNPGSSSNGNIIVMHRSISEPVSFSGVELRKGGSHACKFFGRTINNTHLALSDQRGTGIFATIGTKTLGDAKLNELYQKYHGMQDSLVTYRLADFYLTTVRPENNEDTESTDPFVTDEVDSPEFQTN